jgi:hypothetical protein
VKGFPTIVVWLFEFIKNYWFWSLYISESESKNLRSTLFQKPGCKLNDFTDFVLQNLENYFLI